MNCPKCKALVTRVIDTRGKDDGMEVYRRRRCVACGHKFSTLECITRQDGMKEEKPKW